MAATIDDLTPSLVHEWATERDADDVPHVLPEFGPEHVLTLACWCHPTTDRDGYVQHNVGQ